MAGLSKNSRQNLSGMRFANRTTGRGLSDLRPIHELPISNLSDSILGCGNGYLDGGTST
jgi:hypothetical protein